MATKLSGGGSSGGADELDPRLVALLASLQQQRGQEEQQQAQQGGPRSAPFGMQAGPSLDLLKVLSRGVGMPSEMPGAPTAASQQRVRGDAGMLPRMTQQQAGLPEVGRGARPGALPAMPPTPPLALGMTPGSDISPATVRALLQQAQAPGPMPSLSLMPQGEGGLLTPRTMSPAAAQQALAQGYQGPSLRAMEMPQATAPNLPAFQAPSPVSLIAPPAAAQMLTLPSLPSQQQGSGATMRDLASFPSPQQGSLGALPTAPMAPVQGLGAQGARGQEAMLGAAKMPTMEELSALGMGGFNMAGAGGTGRGTGTGTGTQGTGTNPLARPAQAAAPAATGGIGTSGLLNLLALASKLGGNYLNKPFNQVDLMALFAPAAGTVGGDPLGTGALTNTSADITRPVDTSGWLPPTTYDDVPATEPSTWDYSPQEPGIEPSTWDFGGGDTGTEPSNWDFSSGGDSGFDPSNFVSDSGGGFDLGDLGGLFESINRGVGETANAGDVGDLADIGGATGGGWGLGDLKIGDVGVGDVTPYVGGALGLGTGIANEDPVAAIKGAANLAGAAGVPYVGFVPGLMNLGAGIAAGDPSQIVSGVGNIGTTALSSSGLFTGGAMLPVAAATAIITNIITDELADPKGTVSAMQDYNYLTRSDLPTQLGSIKAAASILPKITDDLTDDQALKMYQVARAAVKNSELLAGPLSMQGQREAGVQYGRYPGAYELVNANAPEAILATIRLQDLLTKRGIDIPEFETATPAQVEAQRLQEQAQNQPGPTGEYTNQHMGMPSEFDAQGMLGGLSPLTAQEALGKIGHYGGFNEVPYGETAEGAQAYQQAMLDEYRRTGTVDPASAQQWEQRGQQYSPAAMAALGGEGPLEDLLRQYLSSLPGYQGSAFQGLWNG